MTIEEHQNDEPPTAEFGPLRNDESHYIAKPVRLADLCQALESRVPG